MPVMCRVVGITKSYKRKHLANKHHINVKLIQVKMFNLNGQFKSKFWEKESFIAT